MNLMNNNHPAVNGLKCGDTTSGIPVALAEDVITNDPADMSASRPPAAPRLPREESGPQGAAGEQEFGPTATFRNLPAELQRQCQVQLNHLCPRPWAATIHGCDEADVTNGVCFLPPKDRISKLLQERLLRVQSKDNIDALTKHFRLRILVNKRLLKDSLEPQAVVDEMVSRNIISSGEKEKILKLTKKDDRVSCLIRSLQEKDLGTISDFLDVLAESGFKHISNVISSTYTDSSGQPCIRDITMKITILDDGMLKDVPNALRKVFNKGARLMKQFYERYGLATSEPPTPACPLTLLFHKSKGYCADKLKKDLLNLSMAAMIKGHLYADDYSGNENVIIDVDLSDLVLSADIDYCAKRQQRNPFCDDDESCPTPLIASPEEGRRHHETLTKDWHARLVAMTTGWDRKYLSTDRDMRPVILQQRHQVSFCIIRTQSPITVFHHAVIKGRMDVINVLFECGILHELADCTVTQRSSPYLDKTAKEITDIEQHAAMKRPYQQILEEEQELPWLHRCARQGDIDSAQDLVQREPDQLQKRDSKGGLPLYWAIMSGCKELVQLILHKTDSGDVLNIGRVDRGGSALCLAASVGHANLVPVLVQYGADPDSCGICGKSALEYAIEGKYVNTIRALMNVGASLPHDALCQSVNTGHVRTFEAILSGHAEVDMLDSKGMCALLYAAKGGHIRILDALLEMGANIRCTNKQQRNVLHAAVESGSIPILQRVLHECRMQHCVRELVNAPDRYIGQERSSIVRGNDKGVAAYHYIECHRWLISKFHDIVQAGGTVDVAHFGPQVVSGWGTSPSTEDMEHVANRYDVNRVTAATPRDLTPLHLLALAPVGAKSTKMAEVLIDAVVREGLSLDATDCFGLSPMHLAAMRGNMDLIRLLWKHGASYCLESAVGHTPADVAKLNNHTVVANYITGHGILSGQPLKEFMSDLVAVRDAFNAQKLTSIRENGASIEIHITENVRPLESSLKKLLFAVGTSPIQPETVLSSVRPEDTD